MKRLFLLTLTLVLLLISILGFSGALPGGDGVIASKTLADGTEVMVTQDYSGELGYQVGFYFRPPGKYWGWCYLAHQDPEWRSGRIEYDAKSDTVLVWNGSTLRGRWIRKNAKWERPDRKDWISSAPQELRNPPFEMNRD